MADEPSPSRGHALGALWAGLGFALLVAGWIIVVPPYAGIDESDHAYRASSVGAGHWQPGTEHLAPDRARGALIEVRADVVRDAGPACSRLGYMQTYNCHPYRTLDDETVLVASAAGGYNPAYYAVVGTLARPFHGLAWLYAARAFTGLICGLLFALAWRCTSAFSRGPLPHAALVLVAYPTTLFSCAVLAPNGPQIMSGLTLWCALLALTHGAVTTRGRRGFVAIAVFSTAVLCLTHTLGLVWFGLICATVLALAWPRAPLGPSISRARDALRPFHAALLGAGLAIMAALAWSALVAPNRPSSEVPGMGMSTPELLRYLPSSLLLWPLQTIGAVPLRDQHTSVQLIGLWAITVLALLGTALVLGRGRLRIAAVSCILVSYAVALILTLLSYRHMGLAWQGRYSAPYTVGVVLLCALLLDRKGLPRPAWTLRWLLPALAVLVVAGQLVAQLYERATDGNDRVWARLPWSEPSALVVAGLALAAGMAWLLAIRAHGRERSLEDRPNESLVSQNT